MESGKALPDLIFLDLGLDAMDGWSFIKALQERMGNEAPPKIYILSAFGKSSDRQLAQNHPLVLGYIDKPLTRNRLESIMVEN